MKVIVIHAFVNQSGDVLEPKDVVELPKALEAYALNAGLVRPHEEQVSQIVVPERGRKVVKRGS